MAGRGSVFAVLAALLRLSLSLFLAALVSGPPSINDGLQAYHYLSLLVLVLGAWFAGRHWHNGPVFLIYGAAGTSWLIITYLSNSNLGYQLAHDDIAVVAHTVWWMLGVAAVAVICNEAGRTARFNKTQYVETKPTVFDLDPADDSENLASGDSVPTAIDRDTPPIRPS